MLTKEVAQAAYDDFKDLHALVDALPDGPEKTALSNKLTSAHASAHAFYRAEGGKYYSAEGNAPEGQALYIITGAPAARDGEGDEPDSPESGGGDKDDDGPGSGGN